jgi:quercetin dioxygenase-like cupin family protein
MSILGLSRPFNKGAICGKTGIDFPRRLWLHALLNSERPAMDIHSPGSLPTRRANPDYFTGTVWQDPIVSAPPPARVTALRVSFEPGARTAWHTHPLGQTLHVLSGVGRVQASGGPIREIRPGDTVWIPPGEKHWHGAAPETSMVHLAVQEALDGAQVEWLEKVSDKEYGATQV